MARGSPAPSSRRRKTSCSWITVRSTGAAAVEEQGGFATWGTSTTTKGHVLRVTRKGRAHLVVEHQFGACRRHGRVSGRAGANFCSRSAPRRRGFSQRSQGSRSRDAPGRRGSSAERLAVPMARVRQRRRGHTIRETSRWTLLDQALVSSLRVARSAEQPKKVRQRRY